MRALVWKAPSLMEIEEAPEPSPGPGEVLLAVEDSGICGSEIGAFLGHNELRKPPLVMGHEFSGVVVGAGEGVPDAWQGRLVAVNPILSCGGCRACHSGLRQLCPSRKIVGVDRPGSYADYVAVPLSACFRVSDPLVGSLVEPLACGVRATALAQIAPGDTVVVVGAGTIGLMAARLARTRGAAGCVVVDTNQARLRWASHWGATAVADPRTGDLQAVVMRSTSGEGADSVIDAVGSSQTRMQSLAAVRRGGRVVLVGLHENQTVIPGNEVVRFEKTLVGSFSYSDEDFRRAVALAEGGYLETTSGWLDVRDLKDGQASFLEQSRADAPFSKIVLRSKA